MTDGLQILAQTVISSNLILVQGLGLYALTRYTKSVREAAGAGVKTLAGMLIGSILLWLLSPIVPSSPAPQVGFYLLVGLVASLAASKLVMCETSGTDQAVDGALVGLLLLLGRGNTVGFQNVWTAFGAGLGFLLVLVVVATVRRRLDLAPIPKPLRGLPILLITVGLLGMALLGFRF
ncbi:MAG TPA: hypothetical protein GX393_09895 [Firmicutes bacterium]|jgi:Na+-translocating ferredoxin:NAD+ oxidoreductase RnfA subunit|nr:hypothetical protein [Bacillota bacterium]